MFLSSDQYQFSKNLNNLCKYIVHFLKYRMVALGKKRETGPPNVVSSTLKNDEISYNL